MVDEVEIVNVKGDSVASEETLLALLETMKKMASSKGFDPKDVDKKVKDLANNMDSLVDIVDDNTNALGDNTDAKEDNTDAVKRNTLSLTNMAAYITTNTIGSLVGFTNELLVGGDSISEFARHIPFVGSMVARLTGVLDNTIESFRGISNIGIDFGESLFELRYAATRSGLSFDTYSEVLKNNSANLALFGGSASAGARAFTDVSRIVQKDFGPQFSALGMTMSQTAQFTADYMDLQRRMGTNQRMSQHQLAVGTGNYVLMLDRLAKITGKQRDQIAEELQAQRNSAIFTSFLSTLEPAIRENVESSINVLPDQFRSGLKDMFATGGSIASEESRNLGLAIQQAGGSLSEFQSIVRGISDGTNSEEDLMSFVRDVSKNMDAETRSRLAFLGTASGNPMFELAAMFGQLSNLGENSADALSEQQKAMERGNQGLLDFERRITDLRNEIVGKLIESGIFQRLETAASNFIDMITGPAGAAAIGNAIDSVVNFFSGFMKDVQDMGFWNAIKNAFLDGFNSLMEEARLQLFGGIRDTSEQQQDITVRIEELESRKELLQSRDKRGDETITQKDFNTVNAQIEQLQRQLSEAQSKDGQRVEGYLEPFVGMSSETENELAGQQMSMLAELSALEERQSGNHGGIFTEEDTARVKELRSQISAMDEELSQQGMFEGMLENLTGVNGVLAGGALATLVVGLGLALTTASLPAIAFGAAIGMAAGGVGYALNAVSNIMDSMTARTEATTDQLERLSNIPDENLHNAASGIERMKEALNNFNPSKMELLGDWLFGDARRGAIESTSSLIQETADSFNNLDPQSLSRAANGISSLSSALKAFNQATAIESVGDLASRLIGYQDAAGAIVTLASSLSVIQTPENISKVAPAIILVASAIGEFQRLTAINSIGEGVSVILQSYVPLAQTITDVASELSNIKTPENLLAISESLPSIILAIDSFQSLASISSLGEGVSAILKSYVPLAQTIIDVATNLAVIETPENLSVVSKSLPEVISAIDSFQTLASISSLGEGVSAILDSYSTVTDPLVRLINALVPIDGTQLTNVAPGIEAVSNALTVFKNSTGFSGLGDLVARWFSDDAMSVGANIKTIADDLSEIDANQLTNSSTAIVAMSNAFEAFSNADVDDITISKTAISRLQILANSSTGLNETATSLERIAGVTNLRQNLDAINEGLDPSGIRTYTDAIDQLVERLNELNEVLAESNDTIFKDNQSAADVLGNIKVSTQGSSEGISQLNTMLSQMLTVLTQSKEIENKIERNTASLSSDTLSGRVSRMR